MLRVAWPGSGSAPSLTRAETLLANDLLFPLPSDAHNPWALSLLLGVRYNDLREFAPSDLPALNEVHGAADNQYEHCLRSPADDYSAGDANALLGCRRFIQAEVSRATNALDAIDTAAKEEVTTWLAIRGRTNVSLYRFAFHTGRALHALQDSYAHAYRNPETNAIRHVLNFSEASHSGYQIERDGATHLSHLDRCGPDIEQVDRVARATTASEQLLRAIYLSGTDRERREAVDRALDSVLPHEEGCDASNGYCNAEEPFEVKGCALAHGGADSLCVHIALICFVSLGLRRRCRPSASTKWIVLILVLTTAEPARADTTRAGSNGVDLYVGSSASYDRGAFAGAVGLRYRATERWRLGVDAEYNPWFSLDAVRFATGTFNVYATVIYTWLISGKFELRSSAHAGISVMLTDLVGIDAGNVGPYVGLNILGISWQVGRRWRFVFDPADFALPIPQVRGVLFFYQQYRITAGFEIGL